MAIMRNLGADRIVQQVLGRGARLEAFKTSMRLADPSGRAIDFLSRAGVFWTRAQAPIEDMSLEVWRAPAPAFVVPPTKDEMARRRDAQIAQLKVLTGVGGAARSLAWNPETHTTETTFDLRARFEQWFALFPEAQRARYRPVLDKNRWPAGTIDVTSLTNLQDAVTVRYGLNVLVNMFNEVKDLQRNRLDKIKDGDRTTAAGLAPLFYWLNEKYEFSVAAEYLLQPWATEDLLDFKLRLRFEKKFGSKTVDQTADHLFQFNAFQLIKVLPQLLLNRPHLASPTALSLLGRATQRLDDADRNHRPVQPLATFYLARLINHWISLVPELDLTPWDLNGAFAMSTPPGLERPSMKSFWTNFGLIDQALFDPDAAPVVSPKSRRTGGRSR